MPPIRYVDLTIDNEDEERNSASAAQAATRIPAWNWTAPIDLDSLSSEDEAMENLVEIDNDSDESAESEGEIQFIWINNMVANCL